MSLITLPPDLLITVMCNAHVLDIIALRQTCKALSQASYERIIWLKQLRQSCQEDHIFLATFAFENMTRIELERACLSPRRSLRAMTRGPTTSRGFAIRHNIRKTPLGPVGGPDSPYSSLFLVPGGRFLVYSKDTEILLYDLGYPGCHQASSPASPEAAARLTPVAAHEVEGGVGIGSTLVYPACDGEALRILRVRTAGGLTLGVVIFEIYPQHPEPAFREIHRYVPNDPLSHTFTTLHKDVLFIVDLAGGTLRAHNIKDRSWTWWDVAPNGHDYYQIFVRGHEVILIHLDGADIWPYPILEHTASPMFSGQPPFRPPAFVLNYSEGPDDRAYGEVHTLSKWYTACLDTPFVWGPTRVSSRPEPPTFPVSGGMGQGDTDYTDDEVPTDMGVINPRRRFPYWEVDRYALKTTPTNRGAPAENRPLGIVLDNDEDSVERHCLSDTGAISCFEYSIQNLRLCEGGIVMIWARGRGPARFDVRGLSPLQDRSFQVPPSTQTTPIALYTPGDSPILDHSTFCPFSGRFAYIKKVSENSHIGTVTVFDLF